MTCPSSQQRPSCLDVLNGQDSWTIDLLPDQISDELHKHLDTFKPDATNLNTDNNSAYYLTKFVKYHISIL